ncbi:MAG: hypothetical protein IKL42_03170, partial [Clostridia bacterium]|nr:hypothetical protein [Clostridia bacterium]
MVKLITDLFLFPMSQIAYLTIIFLIWIAILGGIGIVICFHIKARKQAQPISSKLKYSSIAMLFVFADMIYTILNFGWCRYALMIFYTFQSTLLIIGASISAQYISKSRVFKLLFWLNGVCYILPRITLPDTLANDL